MAFDLFGSETKCDIKVGYISTDRGLVENIGLYEANHHAKLNPGAQFIFRNRDKVEYLNINEVNKLTPERLLPSNISAKPKGCSGIVGLNLDGDTSKSHDDAYEQEVPFTGGTTQGEDGAIAEPNNTRVNFYGGGGVGVQAVPVISPKNGSVMSVIVTQGGYGYKYPPIVDISDDKGVGAGAALKAILRDPRSDDPVFVEEYDSEEDYEEYDLETCAPEIDKIDHGQRFSADGKNLGKWNPSTYLSVGFGAVSDPIRLEIERYQKFLATLQDGSIVDGKRIKDWWTSRKKQPLRITSSDKVTREKFDVQHFAWGGLESNSASNSANNSLNQASSTFGVNVDFIEDSFLVYTSGGQRRDLRFIFKEISGNHTFTIKADDYKDNASAEKIGIQVRRNTKYKVTTTSRKGIRDKGLLKKGTFGTGGDIAQRGGTSNAIFSDIAKTAPDDDDLQVKSTLGIFTDDGKGGITYEFKDSSAFNAGSNAGSKAGSGKGSGNGSNKNIKPSFMNTYAISPVPPSNVPGSDMAGINYTFEWEEEIPWDGTYVFNVSADNESHLYIDNDPVGDKILLGSGGAAGDVLSPPTKITKNLKAGISKFRLDLLNHQIREMKKIQKDVVATSDEVKFDISISSMFANGITIEGLDIDVSKEYGEGKDIKETHTRKVEYGRVYPVKMRSSGFKQQPSSVTAINFTGLNASNNPINVTNNGTRLALKDSGGSDVNASFVIENVTGGSAKFSADGKSIDAKGDKVQVTLSLSWNDDPTVDGVAIQRIKIGSTIWTYEQGKTFSPYTYVTRGDQGVAGLNERDVPTIGITPRKSWPLANTADRYNFNKNRWEVNTSRGWLPTTWEDLENDAGGDEGWVGIPAPPPPGRQMSMEGSVTHTITLSSGKDNPSTIKLKTKGEKVITVEDLPGQAAGSAGVGFFDDIICAVNNGRFFGISGSSCSFMVDPPTGNKGGSNQNQKGTRAEVFNTVDWITKANRKLWKMNPNAGKDCNFINQFGILPFDPTPVAKIEKKVKKTIDVVTTPPNVKFEVGDDGKTYLKVIGNGRVKVGLEMDVDDAIGNRFGAAVREVKIQADDGEIILKRTGTRFEKLSGTGTFSSGKKYLIKSLGGSKTSGSFIGADKTLLQFDDAVQYGFDGRGYANVKITSVNLINNTKQIEETVLGYPDYPSASTDDYAGFHEIIWNNINFPDSGNYAVALMVDDNVELTFSRPNKKDIVIKKDGFRIRGDSRTGTGKSVQITYFESGTYTLKAVLEQISGGTITAGNVMGLAIDIKAAFVSDEIEVISAKSWNENPMGVAMTIDAPLAPPPREPRQQQEGRCPNNPIWTTRASADKTWYPVIVDNWAKFMNRYAISPLPPLGIKGTDGAGTVYRNSWKVDLPYRGYYGVKGTVDDFGKLFIDGVEVLGPDVDTNFDSPKSISPKTKKILLEKKTVDITVEVENKKQFIWTTIDQKIFSTADWASKQNNTSTTIEGPKNVDVTFKVSSASLYANSITLFDGSLTSAPLFFDSKEYGGPNIKETHTHNIEVGKVYDVRLTSSSKRTVAGASGIEFTGLNAANNPIEVTNNGKRLCLKDGDGTDCNASFTIDSGDVKFSADGKSLVGSGSVKFTLSWNDRPRTAGVAVQRIKIGTTTWTQSGRSGSETHTVQVGASSAGGNNNSNIQLRNKGKNVIQMEDWTDNDWADIICSATDGEFYDLKGRTCKFRVPSKDKTTIEYGKGLTPGSSKGGVTYSGPPLSTYVTGTLGPFLTPTWNTDEEYIRTHNGTTWKMTFSNVDFPETGIYDIQGEADDKLTVKLDGVQIASSEVGGGITKTQFNASKGKRTLELTLMNLDFNAPFSQNPAVAALKITRKVDVAKVDPRTGTAQGKPWTVNPLGVSAILIPPPCPKPIRGVGIVSEVTIIPDCDGFDYTPPEPPPGGGGGTPVIIEVVEIVGDPGINYGDDDQVCIVNKETGEEVCYVPPKGPFGEIEPFEPIKVPLVKSPPPTGPDPDEYEKDKDPPSLPPRKPPNGFLTPPAIIVKTSTGIGYGGRPKMVPVIDPIGVDDPARLIQVTDLPGLKQTGYYDGKPYYGAVFYENGIRYAGYYDTPGQKVQIYDTMQESIDATVTTPPSAIQRQGTDINSNDPRLNIPGTPNNLT